MQSISQQLKELKNIGIIEGCIEGISVGYCIDEKKVWQQVEQKFEGFFFRIS